MTFLPPFAFAWVPSWPVNIFPYIFLGYLPIGLTWFMILRRKPDFIDSVKTRVHAQHGTAPLGLRAVTVPEIETREEVTA